MDNAKLAAKWKEKAGTPFENEGNAAPNNLDTPAFATLTPANSPPSLLLTAPFIPAASCTPSSDPSNRTACIQTSPATQPPISQETGTAAVDSLLLKPYVPFSNGTITPASLAAAVQGHKIALINKILDHDILEFDKGVPPCLLRTLPPKTLFGTLGATIEFARHHSQLLVNWRNCQSHHERLKKLRIYDPEGVINDPEFMKEELEAVAKETKAAMGPLQEVLAKHAGQEAVDRVVQNGLTFLTQKLQQDQLALFNKAHPDNQTAAPSSPFVPRSSSAYLQPISNNSEYGTPYGIGDGELNSGPSFPPPPPVHAPNRPASAPSIRKAHGRDYILHNNNPHRYGGALPTPGPMAVSQQQCNGKIVPLENVCLKASYTHTDAASIASRSNTPISRSTTPTCPPTAHHYLSPQLAPEPYQPRPQYKPQAPRHYQGPPPLTPQEKYEQELKAYNAHKKEQDSQKAAEEARLKRQRIELKSDPDVLLHRYREYNTVFPLPPDERVNLYYTKLLANQIVTAADEGSEKAKIVAYAKRNYFNLYRAAGSKEGDRGDEDLVGLLVREEEKLQALGAFEVRKDLLKRKRGVEVCVRESARWL
jgi:hypothetical protein